MFTVEHMNITNFEYREYSESTTVLESHRKVTFIAVISSRKLPRLGKPAERNRTDIALQLILAVKVVPLD